MPANTLLNLKSPRVQTLITGRRKRLTLEEMRHTLGQVEGKVISRQGIQQLVMKITKLHGKEVFDLPIGKRRWTRDEAAAEIGISPGTFAQFCKKKNGKGRHWRIRTAEVMRVKRLVAQRKNLPCPICGKSFAHAGTVVNKRACSKECARETQRKRYSQLARGKPYVRKPSLWHTKLEKALCNPQKKTGKETWLTVGEAHRTFPALSEMQIIWLRYRRLVRTRRHRTKKWHGRAVATYATRDLLVAEKILLKSKGLK